MYVGSSVHHQADIISCCTPITQFYMWPSKTRPRQLLYANYDEQQRYINATGFVRCEKDGINWPQHASAHLMRHYTAIKFSVCKLKLERLLHFWRIPIVTYFWWFCRIQSFKNIMFVNLSLKIRYQCCYNDNRSYVYSWSHIFMEYLKNEMLIVQRLCQN